VTDKEFNDRKLNLEQSVNTIKIKGEQLLGKPLDYLFDMVSEAEIE
jgi:hypothetical protein